MFYGYANLQPNQWRVEEHDISKVLICDSEGKYSLRSNICPHQGSIIKNPGTGKGLSMVCPYHGWSWDVDGNPKGQGTVGHSPRSSKCKNEQSLKTEDVFIWNNFIFKRGFGFSHLNINPCDFELVEQRIDIINANYIPIMDLFLDVDHIPVVHPGVYDRIDIPKVDDIIWCTNYGASVQVVDTDKGELGALWLALYPYVMFEWQPGAVFVMVNQPTDDEHFTNSFIYKYREKSSSDSLWNMNSELWEEAWQQDRKQAEMLEPFWRTIPDGNLDNEKQSFRYYISRTASLR